MNHKRNSTYRNSYNFDNHEFRNREKPQYSSPQFYKYEQNYKIKYFLRALGSDRRLKILLILGIVVVLIVLIAFLLFLLPIFIRIFEFFLQNGIQGVIEYLTELLTQIWEGTGK